MKKILFFAVALAFTVSMVNAQDIKVKESSESFSVGSKPALVVELFEVDQDKVMKEFKSLMKDFGYKDYDSKGDEGIFDNVNFKALGNNPIDVYAKTKKEKDGVRLSVAFDLGGAFLSSSEHKDKFEYMKKMLQDFAVKTTRKAIEDKLEAAQKLLKSTQNKQAELEKDNKNLEGDIKEYEDKIKKAKDKIENNKKEIEVKKKEADAQQKSVDEIKKRLDAVK